MIGFASLFLGLILGMRDVRLVTVDAVSRAVVLLDGTQMGESHAPPWTVSVDFGHELAPHELVAVGYDKDGKEVGRARQWINRPRSPAEVTVVVVRRPEGRVARLEWQSLTGDTPRAITVTVDGEPISFTDPHAIPLPDTEPGRIRVLRAELDFADGVTAGADVTFGGGRSDEAVAQLSALAVSLQPKAKLPPADGLAGWFEARGTALQVAAVEEGPADVVLVPDTSAREPLDRVARAYRRAFFRGNEIDFLRDAARLKKDHRIRIVWPVPKRRQQAEFSYDLFPRSPDLAQKDGGLLFFLTRLAHPEVPLAEQRLSDAVAVAGLAAAKSDRRRAVVLVLGPTPEDVSELDPSETRGFLSTLGVPLFVWCVDRDADDAWGRCTRIPTSGKLESAAKKLMKDLERQRIVWVEGTHLPNGVTLTTKASGIAKLR